MGSKMVVGDNSAGEQRVRAHKKAAEILGRLLHRRLGCCVEYIPNGEEREYWERLSSRCRLLVAGIEKGNKRFR